MGDKLLDLWKTSSLIQGALALLFGGVLCYQVISGAEVPEILASLVGLILGYYFGTKTVQKASGDN